MGIFYVNLRMFTVLRPPLLGWVVAIAAIFIQKALLFTKIFCFPSERERIVTKSINGRATL